MVQANWLLVEVLPRLLCCTKIKRNHGLAKEITEKVTICLFRLGFKGLKGLFSHRGTEGTEALLFELSLLSKLFFISHRASV